MNAAQKKVIRVLKSANNINCLDLAIDCNKRLNLHLDLFIETWERKMAGENLLYLSGGMTNVPNFKENFNEAEKWLSNIYDVVNPAKYLFDISWYEHIEIDLAVLSLCDEIFMLDGCEYSRGAIIEHTKAKRDGINVMYEANKMPTN